MIHRETIAGAQGAYFFLTGVWPLVHLRSFTRITGPKVDGWLVKTVGALIAVVGATMAFGAWRRNADADVALLGVGSAAALLGVDVNYVARRRIAPIYLLDAVLEVGILAAWALALRSRED